ncbi:type IX secretion system periplasmic lipoprotein PorW/SprE [Tenacibaculum caenipelagi]|uniref:Protein involved in gliding motility SprE n=1 Tax=Tenacibaculum caenipelagi TaxID=1325435 RepID=A0A4R6TFI2_9FLAO|nr:tetratricopeptide repeat protein [Tenacibaculum caenipelagi]TDQ28563.1 protein involved in gliding motility SprE [Tenacibaculum caenipelagi]
MRKGGKIIIFSVLAAIVYSCSVKKDAFVNRSYHAVTTKYNVLFNGEQAYLKGLKEIQDKHEDNFWKRLQIEPITFDESVIDTKVLTPGTGFDATEEEENKNLTPFEKAEEKAVKAIQTHSMNINGYEKNSQIDDAYLLLGKARYYTQRFIPALEAFNYVIANYPKANLNYETKIWRAKTNIRLDNEKRAIETLRLLLDVLDETEKINKSTKEHAYTAMAMAYEKTDTIQKVVDYLKLATKTHYNKEQTARNMFVLGQIYSELNRKDSARMVFKKLAESRKAPHRFRIRADIELAKNTPNDSASIVVLARLKKLIKNTDNRKFLNALYYQAGVLEEGRNNPEKAAEYYKKSLEAKHNNNYQKTYAYERLGDMAFGKEDYLLAGSYYDSVMQVVSKEFDQEKRIRRIRRKNKGLTTLRKYEETVKKNDSILKLVAMTPDERTSFFEAYIEKIKKEDEEKRQQLLNAQNFGSSFGGGASINNSSNKGKWYFYNTQALGFGRAEFQKIWGTRPLEDNWRLSDKSINVIDDIATNEETKVNKRYELSTYLDVIPTDEKVIADLVLERNDALYQLGLIYKEQFKNSSLAIKNLERLNEVRTNNQLELPISYHLYQIYKEENNLAKADEYKNIILQKYPETRFAQIIKNPDTKLVEEKKEDEILNKYKEIYYTYKENKFEEAVTEVDNFLPTLKNSNLIPKFALLKALAIGKYQNKETYKQALEFVAVSYATTEEGKKAKEIIEQLNKK